MHPFDVHITMRRLFILLLVALLPLRAWAVEAMSVSMAAQAMSVAQTMSAEKPDFAASAETSAAYPGDCPMLGDSPLANGDKSTQGQISPLCKGCTSCQLCMAMASGQSAVTGSPRIKPVAPAALRKHGYASAELALGFKPPIA